MIGTPLPTATAIYSCRSVVEIKQHHIAHDAFKEFSFLLQGFERALGDEVENEYWKPFVRCLKGYRFEVTAAPLGFGNPVVMSPDMLRWLDARLAQCRMLYPQFVAPSGELLANLNRLVEANDNPLLEYATTLDTSQSHNLTIHRKLTVLIKESRLIPAFEDVLKSRKMFNFIEVVSEAQLRGSNCYENIVCVGPSRWFADHVFSAPRAPRIHVLNFNWVKDRWRPSAVFVGSAQSREDSRSDWQSMADENKFAAGEAAQRSTEQSREQQIEVEELLPTLDLTQISNRFSRVSSASVVEQENAEARLFQLEGRVGVFLDEEDGGSSLVIDLEDEETTRVKRVSVSAIEPGMYVLLREGGGGDYLMPVADKILGKEATGARELQRHWKSKLRDVVNTHGAYTVSLRLKNYGSIRANETNLRNWMSDRNIRTDDKRDFAAIMQLVGLSSETEKYWKNAGLIDSAHRRAGSQIRKLLLRQVLTADLSELEQRGQMAFELAESGGGQMLALRVVARAPNVDRIPVWHIGRLFELEEDAWHA